MNLLSENQIFEIINKSNSKSIDGNLSQNYKNVFTDYYKKLSNDFDFQSFESDLTNNKIVPWINPLDFYKNLNQAINHLEGYESLETKELALTSYLLNSNYFKSTFKNKRENRDKHNELTDNDNSKVIAETVNIRKIKKLFDLIEYTKAAKLGGKLLLGIEDIYNTNLNGVHRIREDLRNLLNESKRINLNRQETVLSVSARFSKINETEYVVDKIEPNDRKNLIKKITSDSIVLNMMNHQFFQDKSRTQLLRVGIELIDDYSCRLEKDRLGWAKAYWNIELEDNSGGFQIGTAIDSKHKVTKTNFCNIAGGKDQNIFWSNNPSLININCDRQWKLNLLGSNLTGYRDIYDLTIHFHISYIL